MNLIDPFGLKFSDIFPGIKKAIYEGAMGGAYAVGEAGKATVDIARHGHPLAQTALSVAGVSFTAPLAGAAAIAASPTAVSAANIAAPYSEAIVDFTYGIFIETGPAKGWGLLSSGISIAYDTIKNYVWHDDSTAPCGGR